MSDIPSEIFREILLRLPAESLFRFRAVCKSWQSLIDDPSFVRSHTSNNHRTSPSLLLIGTDTAFYSFPLDSLNYVNGKQTIHATQVKNMTAMRPLWMAMCNGLILFSDHGAEKNWVIWNTLTGDFHELPHPDVIDGRACIMGAAIGYDSTSDDYKVVRIGIFNRQEEDGVARTLIYSLKSKSWRMIGDWPAYNIDYMTRGVYLNGAVHWRTMWETIVALDLATEEYRELQVAPPPPLMAGQVRRLYAFDGYLVLSDIYDMRCTWVMRGYGTDEPIWVELISFEERSVFTDFSHVERNNRPLLFAYSNSERCLFVQHANRILRWDIEKRSEKRVIIDGLPGMVTSFQVVPGSLFRLNGGGSTSAAMEKMSEEASSSRLKLIATTIPSDGDPARELIKDLMKQVVMRCVMQGPFRDGSHHEAQDDSHAPPQHNGPQPTPYAQGGPNTHSGYGPPQDQNGNPPPMQQPPPHAQPYGQQPRPNQPVAAPIPGPAQTYGQSMPPPQQQCPDAPSGLVQQTYPNPPYGSAPASGGYGQTHPKKNTGCSILRIWAARCCI